MTVEQATILSVGEVFRNARYLVPVYQRAYAWSDDEIATLLRDVHDYNERRVGSYYLGSLVTYTRHDPSGEETYEVVDGQQRLTTLYIILSTLGALHPASIPLHDALVFEGRARSSTDLALLARRGRDCPAEAMGEFNLKVGVETVRAARDRGEFTESDLAFLIDDVKIVRTTLPARTDLNHYFEVMNSRGEQLEKHEIVKASLMGKLSDIEDHHVASRAFALVWDACSDMSKHVQGKFGSRARAALFGEDWDTPGFASFDDVVRALKVQGDGSEGQPMTLAAILGRGRQPSVSAPEDQTDATDRYGAIIDFPNFLLHVLALSCRDGATFLWSGSTPVALDDKQLVEQFDNRLRTPAEVKQFAVDLLRARYLFDRYVIKTDRSRESEDDSNWVLRRVRKLASDSGQKLSPIGTFSGADDGVSTAADDDHVVLLQSMFQVSDSRRSYKNFLYAILEYLVDQNSPIEGRPFADFLAQLAADRHRHLSQTANLDTGTLVPHFAFNYLDYLLWRQYVEGERPSDSIAFGSYRFRYRTSVEHFYPQNPSEDSMIAPLPSAVVDQFGNLCLMSRSDNSQRSNLAPDAKIRQYRSERQSLKFQVMAACARAGTWNPQAIERHGLDMIKVLDEGSGFNPRDRSPAV